MFGREWLFSILLNIRGKINFVKNYFSVINVYKWHRQTFCAKGSKNDIIGSRTTDISSIFNEKIKKIHLGIVLN